MSLLEQVDLVPEFDGSVNAIDDQSCGQFRFQYFGSFGRVLNKSVSRGIHKFGKI